MSVDATPSLHDVYGRKFGINENYILPSDDTEYERLKIQHATVFQGLGGLYPSQCKDLVEKVLTPTADDPHRAAADIGSGSGIWAIELAQQFPEAHVLGIDIAPNPVITPPANCSFNSGDVRDGFPQYQDKFNLWHSRSLGHALKPDFYGAYVKTAHECLKPGGLLLIGEGDGRVYDENHNPVPYDLEPGDPNYSYLASLYGLVQTLGKVPAWLLNIRHSTSVRLVNRPDFENVGYISVYIPIGWAGPDGTQAELGELVKKNIKILIRAYKPILISYGLDEETIQKWWTNVDAELDSGRKKLMSGWHFTWGTKKFT